MNKERLEESVLARGRQLFADIGHEAPSIFNRNRWVGNLYVNRGITGAIVGRQPFGGFKMSGVGSKAGGPDYLLQFLNPRAVTENTMRRGFVPGSVPGFVPGSVPGSVPGFVPGSVRGLGSGKRGARGGGD